MLPRLLIALLILVSLARIGWASFSATSINLGSDFLSTGVQSDSANLGRFKVLKGTQFPMQVWPVAIEPNMRYQACLTVFQASDAINVVVDVMGTGYDNEAQEHRFSIRKNSSASDYCFRFDSEIPPANTSLRVMFDGPAGFIPSSVEFGKPRLERLDLPDLEFVLGGVQFTLFALTCMALIWPVAKRIYAFKTGRMPDLNSSAIYKFLFCIAILCVSITPAILTLNAEPPDVEKVQELRLLAAPPARWEGNLVDIDRNFKIFERWFNDHLAYRSLMIRLKNQIDYMLFQSSSRVYFGDHNEIYGRPLVDRELVASEKMFSNPKILDGIIHGLERMAKDLQVHDMKLIVLAPMQRQHFSQANMPFFAPKIAEPSKYLTMLLPRLKRINNATFIDVYPLIADLPTDQPRYFKQDFHWSDFSARAASIAVANAIYGGSYSWKYPVEIYTEKFVGSETRFAALLSEKRIDEARIDTRTWPATHVSHPTDSALGYEYETNTNTDPSLLPSTCGFGNSFMDGMIRVGFQNHFQKFTRLSRKLPINQVVDRSIGRCKYLVVQILDIQTSIWSDLSEN